MPAKDEDFTGKEARDLPTAIEPFDADRITLDNWDGIKKCRKKPIVIHAVQMNLSEGFKVTTPEGVVTGKAGDYLMFGVEGEKYPCRKDIFEKTYDILADQPEAVPDEPQHRLPPDLT